jgi:hypothetical protein
MINLVTNVIEDATSKCILSIVIYLLDYHLFLIYSYENYKPMIIMVIYVKHVD